MSRDFWARRKAAVEAEAEAEKRAEAAAEAAQREQALEDKSDEEILAELELPDPDTLEEGDDFKVFLRDVVPARIRTRALRRLWRLNPVLANVDGLVDYGEDFTDSAMVVEGMQTAYQVGKGMTKHVEELARQAAEKEQAAQLANAPEDAEAEVALAPEDAQDSEPVADEEYMQAEAALGATADHSTAVECDTTIGGDRSAEAGDTDPVDILPRRMRFSFDQDCPEARETA